MNYTEFFKKIDAEIKKADSIVILRHESPDPDAIGSQVGLREIIRATYPEKTVNYFLKLVIDCILPRTTALKVQGSPILSLTRQSRGYKMAFVIIESSR